MTAPPLDVAIYLAVLASPFAWMLVMKWRDGRACRKWWRENGERVRRVARWN